MKKNIASSQDSPSYSSMGDETRSVQHGSSQITDASFAYGIKVKQPKPQKEAVRTYEDVLYMPSGMSKNKQQYKEFQLKSKIEHDFRALSKKLGKEFSFTLCAHSPYLESIMNDLDNLNQLFQQQQDTIKALTTNARIETTLAPHQPLEHSQSMSPQKPLPADFTQAAQIQAAMTIFNNQNSLNAQKMELRAKENDKLQKKVKQLDELTEKMRKNYYKDLLVYQNPKNKNWKTEGNMKNKELSEEDQIHVEFFNALEGVDPDILEILNQRLFKVKEKCEKRIYQEELLKKIYALNKLSPNAYSMVNLSLEEIFQALKVVYPNPEHLWDEIHNAYGQDCLLVTIEREYGDRFAKDYTYLNHEIDKVNQEAQFQIKEVLRQSQNEIQSLRKTIDDKNQEMIALVENQMKEIEKVQKDTYANAELQFQSKEAQLFVKHDQEKQELYQKIQSLETLNTDFDKIMTKHSLLFAMNKLGILAQMHKILNYIKQLQSADTDNLYQLDPKIVENSIQRVFDILMGKTSQDTVQMKSEYEKDIKNLMDENNQLGLALQDKKMILEQQFDKVNYLEQRLEDSYQEAQMYKNKVDSMIEDYRRLEGEHSTLKRALENSQRLAEGYEKEKKRLEFELQKIAGSNVNKYQSAYAEADIHRRKALNSISTAGTTTLNNIYSMNSKTKGTKTYLKDVNNDLEMIKKNQDGTASKIKNQLLNLFINQEIQTDADIMVISQEEYHNFDKSRLMSSKRLRSANGINTDDAFSLEGTQDQPIQCELINANLRGRTPYDQSILGANMTMSDWKSRNDLDQQKQQQNFLQMYEQQRANLLKSIQNMEQNMPDVYRRLWINVFERAAKNQRIRDEFDKIRKEQFDKIDKQVNGMAPYSKTKNIFHKDSITGKVFINLVELYKNTQNYMFPDQRASQVQKVASQNSTKMNLLSKRDYSERHLISSDQLMKAKILIDTSTQTDTQENGIQSFMDKRLKLQSRGGYSRNTVLDQTPLSAQQTLKEESTERDQDHHTRSQKGISILMTQKEFYNMSKMLYIQNQQKRQRSHLNGSHFGTAKPSTQDASDLKIYSTTKTSHGQRLKTYSNIKQNLELDKGTSSIFEVPTFMNHSFININQSDSPRVNTYYGMNGFHSKKSSMGANLSQSRDSTHQIYLKQPLVRIIKNMTIGRATLKHQ